MPRVSPVMAYRDDLAALETRRAALQKELDGLRTDARTIDTRRTACEAELASVRAVLDGSRRSSLPLLDGVEIASPCSVGWDAMKGDERVRFCGTCSKNVYNLSAMSRAEAEALLRENNAVCMRLYRHEDGTVLTTDCSMGVRRARLRGVAVATLAAMTLAVGARGAMLSNAEINVVSVGRLVSEAPAFEGRLLRVDGTLVAGSLLKLESPCEYRFRIAGDGKEIPVHYPECIVPDTFRDVPGLDLSVMVEGELRPDGSFEASQVLAKTASGARMMKSGD